ncbi:MAG: hypothetical protein BGO38_10095 [Cellulomonas sp. 73-145]|uniref:helix-turn-helix transcriptional regulator n=1 Tax=Cellulomonas sp. 73-145 TaxID=1895739 RepID=UPI000926A306|nr:helix-turn-helix domain-containing protein [Cellulomonas sp. 73-145]OJV60563.1 MAG: hypothetical protein BGO38_10095 [Cellulomonas sp. 73-145]
MTAADDASTSAALASPARRRVLDAVRAAAEPPTAQQLAVELDLHVTTVRFHLDLLEQSGLVERVTRHAGRRGRPSVHYRAVGPAADVARDQMIEALAEALAASGAAAHRESAAAGRRWADQLAARADTDPDTHIDPATRTDPAGQAAEATAAISEVFGRLGFDPEAHDDTIRLRSCPFRETASRYPEIVCQVHTGLAQRLAERAFDGERVQVRLTPFVEPELCVLRLAPRTDDALVR